MTVQLVPCRNAGVAELLPTMTTTNVRTLVLLSNGKAGMLRTSDAERLQVKASSITCTVKPHQALTL